MLDAAATRAALPFPALLKALEHAAYELDEQRIACPPRQALPLADRGVLLSMPAAAADIACHKLVSVMPGNARRGLPVIQGQVSVIDAVSGRVLALLDGPTVTGRRTAAVSMLALRAAGPHAPRRVLLFGAGVQARHHVDALAALHPQARLAVRASSQASAAALCDYARSAGLAAEPDRGARDHDLVITCTTSREPVYDEPARAGCLVIAVGAFQADTAEIAAATVRASRCFVDDPAGARHEAGDLLRAGIEWNDVGSLAALLRHGAPTGTPLLFKSVGSAAWDLAAARAAVSSLPTAAPRTAPG